MVYYKKVSYVSQMILKIILLYKKIKFVNKNFLNLDKQTLLE